MKIERNLLYTSHQRRICPGLKTVINRTEAEKELLRHGSFKVYTFPEHRTLFYTQDYCMMLPFRNQISYQVQSVAQSKATVTNPHAVSSIADFEQKFNPSFTVLETEDDLISFLEENIKE